MDIQTLAAELIKMAKMREMGVIHTLFRELYAHDIQSLRIDLAKLELLGTAPATPSQRATLLRVLYGAVALYVDDFSKLLAMVEQVEDAYKMEDSSLRFDTLG